MIEKYLAIPAYGKLSSLEIASLKDSANFDFTIFEFNEHASLLEAESKTAKNIAKRLGGFYKLVRICGETFEELFRKLPLPESAKFNWTVSKYGCDAEIQSEAQEEVSMFLKENSLGKARYVKHEAEPATKLDSYENALKLVQLERIVLSGTDSRLEGLDVVVYCADGRKQFGYTEFISDLNGYEKRDFSRSYQDPTTTIGPRLARVLVNLSGVKKGEILVDPFCGLGTILQEALICGCNVVGADISHANVRKTISNLQWLKKEFQISPKLWSHVIRADSMELENRDLPRVDGVATEPLLVPKFEKNPTSSEAEAVLRKVREQYEQIVGALARLIPSGRKAVLVAPGIIDEVGKVHSLEIECFFEGDFDLYSPSIPNVMWVNPCVVPTGKKKVIQRRIYVMKRL